MHCHFETIMALHGQTLESFPGEEAARVVDLWIRSTRTEAVKLVYDADLPAAVERFAPQLMRAAFDFPGERTWFFEWSGRAGIQSILAAQRPNDSRLITCFSAIQRNGKWFSEPCAATINLADARRHIEKGGNFECLKDGKTVKALIAFLALLHREDIEIERVIPDETVNRKRLAVGKAPLSAYAVVRISRWRG
jgi:hypothetical protein